MFWAEVLIRDCLSPVPPWWTGRPVGSSSSRGPSGHRVGVYDGCAGLFRLGGSNEGDGLGEGVERSFVSVDVPMGRTERRTVRGPFVCREVPDPVTTRRSSTIGSPVTSASDGASVPRLERRVHGPMLVVVSALAPVTTSGTTVGVSPESPNLYCSVPERGGAEDRYDGSVCRVPFTVVLCPGVGP